MAWSVPIKFENKIYVIEHRKMGLGVFAEPGLIDEVAAEKIINLVNAAVTKATLFFESLAEKAVKGSRVNVLNKSASLYSRFEYLRDMHKQVVGEAVSRAGERIVEEKVTDFGKSATITFPAFDLQKKAEWLGLAAVDAFFSWTEHVMIHIAILQGKIATGEEVADRASADWPAKFKGAIDLGDPATKRFFDDLLLIRRQLRNYMAHGAFGRRGEAFTFHSPAGAVPVLLPHQSGGTRFTLVGASAFENPSALDVLERFVDHLWSGVCEPAKMYIQDTHLPLILSMAVDGTYKEAMKSAEDMEELIRALEYQFDQAANMDW
ncbi:MAG: hypothetical protein ABI217_08400 [Chthoniobacterales bacterium]